MGGRSRRLLICMLIQSYYPRVGGAERQLQALTPRLARRGVDVVVVTRRHPGMASRDRVAGAPVYRTPRPGGRLVASLAYTVGALVFLARRRRRIHVVHAHELLSPTTTAVLARVLLGRPIVVKVLRGGRLGDIAVLKAGRLGRARLWLFTRLVNAFVAISDEIEAELRAAGVEPSRIARIPNGVDAERFRPADPGRRTTLRAELGLEGCRVALFLGRLEPEKGLDCLLEAWPAVRRGLPNALLVLAGDGTQRPELEARQVAGVRFVGAIDDPLPLLQAADCFVLPSYTEGLSNALLEAMAAGLPPVATRIGGSVDVVGPGQGRLVPPADARALAEAIVDLLGQGRREQVGAAARARVDADYSLEATADRLAELYRRLAG